jgi:hypothetical protein
MIATMSRAMAIFLLAGLGACSGPERRADFDSNDPQEQTLALAEALNGDQQDQIPALIRLLDSPDPATRMLAIGTLNRWTGQTLGYDHAASEPKRKASADRWEQWARDQGLVAGRADDDATLASPESDP